MAYSFWTDERIAVLTKLWLDGASGEAVAREIGDGCTRNAVIGKANRLGLPAHPKSTDGRTSAAALRRVALRKRLETVTGFAVTKVQAARAKTPEVYSSPPRPKNQGLPLLDLPANGCRWAINDAARHEEHLFCGEPRIEGSSWCCEHNSRAYGRPWPPKPFVLKMKVAA